MMKKSFGLSGLLLSVSLAAPVYAQNNNPTVSAESYLAYLQEIDAALSASEARASKPVVGRGTSVGVSGAFTLQHGTFFGSGSISNKRRNPGGVVVESTDASAAFGVGFGDAAKSVGFDVVLGLDSVDPDDFGDSGTLSLKVSRNIASFQANQSAAVALGVGSISRWGDSKGSKENKYIVYSSTFEIEGSERFVPGLLSVGYGSNIGSNERGKGIFASAGVGVTDWLSLGAGIAKDEYHLGGNVYRKFGEYDGSISFSYVDSTKKGIDGRRLNLGFAVATPKLF